MNEVDVILAAHRRDRRRVELFVDIAVMLLALVVLGVLWACGVVG